MKFSTLLLPLCILTTAQADDDASVSPFTYQQILNEPPVTLEEQTALRAAFFDAYEKFMVHLFKQVNEMYTAGENGTEYDSGEIPAGERWTALDANNVHNRIQRYCKPEFDDAQQIISVDCGVSYAPEFLYSHPDYDNIYITLYSYSIVDGATGGTRQIGNGVHIAQTNEPTSPEDKLMRIKPKTISDKVLITLDPPDFYCEFESSKEPMPFGSSEQGKNCSAVLREGRALLQRLL